MPLMPEIFSRLNLYNVLHCLPDGVTLADAEGRIIFSNAAADRILGTTAATDASSDEWSAHYGVFLLDGATPFPTSEYPLLRALGGEHPHDVEMVVRNETRPDGAIISVSDDPSSQTSRSSGPRSSFATSPGFGASRPSSSVRSRS